METMEIFDMDRLDFWPDPDRRPRRVVAAMSGGADSTFAAWLLCRAGVEVIGIHLVMGDFGEPEDGVARCCSRQDARDARRMAELLGIPFYLVAAQEEFRREVMLPFAADYARGLTPNPCVRCNPQIKWRLLLRKARELGADAVATGHYARAVRGPDGRMRLLTGRERRKEQSYFLARLGREQLESALFPAGGFQKSTVLAALRDAGLPVADKPESQDVCFVGPGGYVAAVEALCGRQPAGEIVDLAGRVLGRHRGLHRFTVGQRRGAGVSGREPLYVVDLDPARNRVVLGPWEAGFCREAMVQDMRWLAEPPAPAETVQVLVRYRARAVPARVEPAGPGRLRVRFEEPQRAVSPGQAAVFYRGDEVLGGGLLARVPREAGP